MGKPLRPALALAGASLGLLAGCVDPVDTAGLGSWHQAPPDLGFRPPIDLAMAPPGGGPPPQFGPTQTQADPPPPISGGTLLATRDGKRAVAADPDRDTIFVVDLAAKSVASIALQSHDEPGRAVEDGAGRVHVVLRRGGVVADVDPAAAALLDRRAVCPAPRGIAYDAPADALLVACAGGELVTLPAAGGAPTRTVELERDLRDVVFDGTQLVVSSFRRAELLYVDANGAITQSLSPPQFLDPFIGMGAPFSPAVAWRTVALPSGGVLMVHQRALDIPIVTMQPGGYGQDGGKCPSSIVHSTVSVFTGGQAPGMPSAILPDLLLPVDVAVSPDGQSIAVAAPGNARIAGRSQVAVIPTSSLSGGVCVGPQPSLFSDGEQVTAVAYAPDGTLLALSREPAQLYVVGAAGIALSSTSRYDTGHDVFHSDSGGGIACASCHPEGGEDGRVWSFDFGQRRTQSIRGGVLASAPFHWSGDLADFPSLFKAVFVGRMSGQALADDKVAALSSWVNAIPPLPASPPPDAAAVARGQALFADPNGPGCFTCHSGPRLSDHAIVDVGTGSAFKVPSLLGVGFRAPFLHDGCAPTLADRFGPCGGGDMHGRTSSLTSLQISDLVAYLESL
jgi:mono/diheme cytochrome c family protein